MGVAPFMGTHPSFTMVRPPVQSGNVQCGHYWMLMDNLPLRRPSHIHQKADFLAHTVCFLPSVSLEDWGTRRWSSHDAHDEARLPCRRSDPRSTGNALTLYTRDCFIHKDGNCSASRSVCAKTRCVCRCLLEWPRAPESLHRPGTLWMTSILRTSCRLTDPLTHKVQ